MKKLLMVALAVMALSLCLMPAVGVSAAQLKIEVSGSFGLHTWAPYDTLEVGPNVIYFVEIGASWTGDLVGDDIGLGVEIDRANGLYVLNSITTWTGELTIDGVPYSGTMQITTASRGLYGPSGFPIWFTGTMTLVGLSGDLAGVHGKLTFGPGPPYPVAYSGWIML